MVDEPFSTFLALAVYDHMSINNLLPNEQKGCRKKSRGTKDQLMIDRAILREVKAMKRNLNMCWIDYKKAYDMVPHSWILEMLDMVGIAQNVTNLVRSSMEDWRVVLTAGGQTLGDVNINRGIFQGDSLSPLIFVICLTPLSLLLRREKLGYSFGESKVQVNHLLFMDDLKLFGKNSREIDALIEITRIFSRDIGMSFGLDKCAVIEIKRGVKVRSEGITLPTGEQMKEVDDEGYRYLGVLEGARIKNKEMKEKLGSEYLRRVKLLARSKLYSGNLIRGINAWAVSVVRYSAGILEWTDKELKRLDTKTRKLLAMNGAFHRSSSVGRLYIGRKEGGRGLISVQDCVRQEELGLEEYVLGVGEPMMEVIAGDLDYSKESKAHYKQRRDEERKEDLANKPLHGKFFREMDSQATGRSIQWVIGGFLAKSTEAFVFAAQEQALKTRLAESKWDADSNISPLCRVCGEEAESVWHLTSGCKVLAQREYRRRHDRMGLRVYWELCRKYGLKSAVRWFEEVPDKVRKSEDGRIEIWWDRSVETTQQVESNRPDVVVVDHHLKKWLIVDFAVPSDRNVSNKEQEKIAKYSPLAHQIRKLHSVSTSIVPIVVGALGVVTKGLENGLKELDIPDVLGGLQTSAIIGTTNILRKVLNL
ncbi:MAG: reverse transcriptase family protein [Bacteroidota bacterium]